VGPGTKSVKRTIVMRRRLNEKDAYVGGSVRRLPSGALVEVDKILVSRALDGLGRGVPCMVRLVRRVLQRDETRGR
jgi:hypothetical protein